MPRPARDDDERNYSYEAFMKRRRVGSLTEDCAILCRFTTRLGVVLTSQGLPWLGQAGLWRTVTDRAFGWSTSTHPLAFKPAPSETVTHGVAQSPCARRLHRSGRGRKEAADVISGHNTARRMIDTRSRPCDFFSSAGGRASWHEEIHPVVMLFCRISAFIPL